MELELKNIYKNFGEKQVLTGISLNAKSGEAFGLLGRNGAGKTTTIRILMNVFPANAGEVLVDGKPINYNKIGIGYLPEERGLYPKKPIIDQLIYFAQLKGMKYAPAVKSIDKWLERLGMSEYRNKRLDTLSKGNQQKIQLITALAHNPDIVILDEPFSGLDPVNAQLLKDVVKEEINRGKIVLFSSHQMNYIEEFCDNIAILNGGKVVLQGNLHNIKRNYTRDKLIVKSLTDIEKILTNQDVKSEKSVKRLDSDTLILELNSPDNKQNVMKVLTEQFDIDEIKVFEPSLNDIFVEYAGKQV
ncbi:MAG: ATP-binding cassette domain-containing protein [Ruminococcus bromii]|nr:ATP-binding cassette domain-containing protein [Ruminococcus bromii]MDY4084213.1 ATP-binding cassette domain-containing protein [Ruminococcus bromii]